MDSAPSPLPFGVLPSDNNEYHRYSARLKFLGVVRSECPDALEELGEAPSRAYRALVIEAVGDPDTGGKVAAVFPELDGPGRCEMVPPRNLLLFHSIDDRDFRSDFGEAYAKLPPHSWDELRASERWNELRERMVDWAHAYGLASAWAIEAALSALSLWIASPEHHARDWGVYSGGSHRGGPLRYEVAEVWQPRDPRSFDEWRKSARQDLIDRFERDAEAIRAHQAGALLAPARFRDSTYRVLARRQVAGMTWEAAAKPRSRGGVQPKAEKLADFLGLELRR